MSKNKRPSFFSKIFKKKNTKKGETKKAEEQDQIEPSSNEDSLNEDNDSGDAHSSSTIETTKTVKIEQIQKQLDDNLDVENTDSSFPIEETPPMTISGQDKTTPNIPLHSEGEAEHKSEPEGDQNSEAHEDTAYSEEEKSEVDSEDKEIKESDRTEVVSKSIDIDEIKNYEFTHEDEENEDSFANYQPITKKENKGLRAFLNKSKEDLENFFKKDYKNLLKNIQTPKKLKSSSFLKKLNFEKVIEALYGPHSKKIIHRTFLASMLLGGSYSTGKIIALVIKGTPNTSLGSLNKVRPSTKPNNINADINSIKSANLFNALLAENQMIAKVDRPKVINEDILCQASKTKSSLPIKLQNTLVLQDSVKSIASVQMRSNKTPLNVREGEKLDGLAKVGKITRFRLILKNLKTGECEYIENSKKKSIKSKISVNILDPQKGKKLMDSQNSSGIKNKGNSYSIKKSVRDEMLSNISEVLTQARAVQIKNPDGSLSFKMTEIVPGSIYSKLGIQNNDIIAEIDGKKIQNLNEIMSKFGTIKDRNHFSLGLRKNGSIETKEYDFE